MIKSLLLLWPEDAQCFLFVRENKSVRERDHPADMSAPDQERESVETRDVMSAPEKEIVPEADRAPPPVPAPPSLASGKETDLSRLA